MATPSLTFSKPRLRFRPARLAIYALLLLAASFYILPIYLILLTSFKPYSEISLYQMWGFPSLDLRHCTNPLLVCFDSFYEAWFGNESILGMGHAFLNSTAMAIPATLISTALGSVNGYILAKWKFKYARYIFPLILFGMFIPYQSILIPMKITLRVIGLDTTLGGLILVHIIYGLPVTTLLFHNYYASIPKEMLEAAQIDGGHIFTIYRHIILPLSPPAIGIVLIWQFTSIWNDFLFAVTIVQNERQTMTVALNNLAGSFTVEWNVQMAAALLTALPTLVIYIILGRYFVRGLLAGSLKG